MTVQTSRSQRSERNVPSVRVVQLRSPPSNGGHARVHEPAKHEADDDPLLSAELDSNIDSGGQSLSSLGILFDFEFSENSGTRSQQADLNNLEVGETNSSEVQKPRSEPAKKDSKESEPSNAEDGPSWERFQQRPTSTKPVNIPIKHHHTHTFERIEAIYI